MFSFGDFVRRLFGDDDAGANVPAMDGVFKPDDRLERAERVLSAPEIDNLFVAGGQLHCSSGNKLFILSRKASKPKLAEVASFNAPISFAVGMLDGSIAVGVVGEGIHVGSNKIWRPVLLPSDLANCLTAGVSSRDGRLFVCVGSRDYHVHDWKRDLMALGNSGVVIEVNTQDGSFKEIATGLAFPAGIAVVENGSLVISESWRYRLLSLEPVSDAKFAVLQSNLPAYPSRLSPSSDGGFWLAFFAPRRQLFELVLREKSYRQEMMDTIDPDEWVGPDLRQSANPNQPLQQGSVRQMGVLKPWGPSRSYGLIAKCNVLANPIESWHSRADGAMHGITSMCEINGFVYVASRGSGTLLRMPLSGSEGGRHA